MKKIINGKKYDTDTAECLANYEMGGVCCNDVHYVNEALYRKATGEYFLVGEGGAYSCYGSPAVGGGCVAGEAIRPLSLTEAKAWAEIHMSADAYEAAFGPVED